MPPFRLMHQAIGVVEHFTMINGFSDNGQQNGCQYLHIMAKEMAPIIMSCAVWGPLLIRSFKSDNTSIVAAITKGSANDDLCMHLLRCLWFFVAYYDISISIVYVPGHTNCTADHLSRHHMTLFSFCTHRQIHPQHLYPKHLPL